MLHLIACYQGKFDFCIGVDDVVCGFGAGNLGIAVLQPDPQIYLIVGVGPGESVAGDNRQGQGNADGNGGINTAGKRLTKVYGFLRSVPVCQRGGDIAHFQKLGVVLYFLGELAVIILCVQLDAVEDGVGVFAASRTETL